MLLLPAQTSLCCWLALVIRHVILLQQKREKKREIRSIKKKTSKPTLNCQSSLTILVFQMTINTKKSRIGLLHKHQSPEGIQLTWTIISQIYRKKKDLPTSANDTKSIAYLCDTTTMLWNCLFGRFHKKQFYTRCTQNLFKWHPTQSFNKPIMPFLKGRNTMLHNLKS